ncbi:N-acetylmuramoyl-L-alanine amidase [Cyanobacterium stanieri LEGE 03274]|uniref:N-acetylmuramoyl-L-alanine amidase n=1 Tax=Cyanobacterium stanieri LEGE 03274 TaxID=1828756 RepID=A0ABR9V387_9CHRO|nr:N-acetylmuramoyl-L-alanine amidase [Cyanobacterium stanieri LEGE 03274]
MNQESSCVHAEECQDPENSLNLEFGQYWNNHYIAICLSGWFCKNRQSNTRQFPRKIPNFFTKPSKKQIKSLLYLISILRKKYNIPIDNIRGHRELNGCDTTCPGENFDLHKLRTSIQSYQEKASSSQI